MGKVSFGAWVAFVCLLATLACSTSGGGQAPPVASTCVSDSDCAGLRCDARLGCVACLFDADCGDGRRCDGGSCATRIPCATAADCKSAAAPACDQAVGECFECATNTDCKTGEKCDKHTCRPYTACSNSLDCPSGTVCDGTSSECVDCVSDADCTSDKVCVENSCQTRCASDKDCAAHGLLCDASLQHCVECVGSSDCPARYHCATGSCERDACEEGATRCAMGAAAIETCAPPGSAWLKLLCNDQQSCRELGGQAQCADWVCTPGATQCSADARRVETCNADGLGTTLAQACEANQTCVAGTCQNVACQPGTNFCRGSDIWTCNADGTSSSVTTVCTVSTRCDPDKLTCAQLLCTPGSSSCVDGQLGTCNEQGTAYEGLESCGKDAVCDQNACVAIACDPNKYSCTDAGQLRICNATGTRFGLVATCGGDTFCVTSDSGDKGSCNPSPCEANQVSCDGDIAKTCKPDGSGFVDGGTDCAKDGKACADGACQPKVCDAGKLFCGAGGVWLCNQQGTKSTLFQTCTAGQFCDDASPACKTQVCTPNAPSCNGSTAATCNSDGSGWLAANAIDCAATKKVCASGVCKTKVCNPNSTFCKSGDVYQCDATGANSTLSSTCTAAYYFCSQNGDTAQCSYDVCVADKLGCSGNTTTICKSDGAGWDLGTDCGAKVCVNGACATKTCTPGTYQCSGAKSQQCDNTGTVWNDVTTCSGDTFCNVATGRCDLDTCPATAKACLSEVSGTCNADGSALTAGGTDCKASNKLCTLAGCATSATDTFGDASQSAYLNASSLSGDIVLAQSARQLTQIQQNLYVSSGYSLRWVVYSSSTLAGPYQPIFDVATKATGAGFESSGPISVQLQAGTYYFFGVFGSPYYVYYQQSPAAQYASFGRGFGMYGVTAYSLPNSFNYSSASKVANIKLTTVLP